MNAERLSKANLERFAPTPTVEKGRTRWETAARWGAGTFIAVTALFSSWSTGALAALIGGVYGYRKSPKPA